MLMAFDPAGFNGYTANLDGDQQMYPGDPDDDGLAAASKYLTGTEVEISISLGAGAGAWRAYGCDLTEDYVRINSEYST